MFTEQYQQSPQTAFANLVDWLDIPENERRTVLGGLLSLAQSIDGSKTYPINSSETKLYTIADYSRDLGISVSDYNEGRQIPITHVLEVEMSLGPGATSTATLDIGSRDGKCFIYPER